MDQTAATIEGILSDAVSIASEQERRAYLDSACAGDPELRARVERLVDNHFRAGSFLKSAGIPMETALFNAPGESAGAQIGPYRLLEQIGEGGMGLVFVAQQHHPVRRTVALKVIKPGMDSKQVIARFQAERQALALMDHPNIAKVLDAGTTESGRPYFVMELVRGIPITDYCDQARLTVRQRLEVFVQVCRAVQHAHTKGVIHRDIKPSNVLVTSHDGVPMPLVIDFGVAKALGGQLTEQTLHTGFAQMLGTPLYMSPEQAEYNHQGVDTRSDIYSLGVLLYELLTGVTPFDRDRLRTAGFDEFRRILKEEEPPKPSTRLSTLGAALSTASDRRGVDPRKLSQLVHGELDWIVLRAMEKDRTRRYETASSFAADVERYLNDEAVLAHPPSSAYRLKKFLRKNKGPVIAASLVLLALLGGIVVSAYGLMQANRFAAREQAAKEQAQTRLTQVEKGNAVLTSIFDDLDIRKIKEGTEPLEAVLAKRLTRAAELLEGETVGDPLVVAGLQNKLGDTLLNLGYPQEAIPLFQKARETRTSKLGNDHPDTLESMNSLASGYEAAGKLDLSLPLQEETLKLIKVKLGADHHYTLICMHNLASGYRAVGKIDLALSLQEETLKLQKAKLGADHPDTLNGMNNLALSYEAVGKLDLSLPLFEETVRLKKLKLGADHPDTLKSMANLANGYRAAGKHDLALRLSDEALTLRKAKLGPDHPDTLASMGYLASDYQAAGKLDLALPLREETLKLMKIKLGADHLDTLNGMNNLALSYQAAGKLDLSLPLLEETVRLKKVKLGPDHPDTLTSMDNLALGYQAAGKFDLSLPLQEETMNRMKKTLGVDHPSTLISMGNLSKGYQAAKKFDLALPLQEETMNRMKKTLGADHPHTLTSMDIRASGYWDAGKHDLALPLREETLKLQKIKLGADHPETLKSMNNLALCYQAAGKLDLALPLLEETIRLKKVKLGADHPHTLTSMDNLAVGYQVAGKLDLALPLFEETLKIRRIKLGADNPETLESLANLGKAYCDAKQGGKAALLLTEFLVAKRKAYPKDDPALASLLAVVSLWLLNCDQFSTSEPLLRECLAIRGKREPDDWGTFCTQAMLGGALLGQKKYADAEPLLLAGYEGMKQREDKIPSEEKPRLPEAVQRLVELYEATNQPEKARLWREKLAPQ